MTILKSDRNVLFSLKSQAMDYIQQQGYTIGCNVQTYMNCFSEKERCPYDLDSDWDIRAFYCTDDYGDELLVGYIEDEDDY